MNIEQYVENSLNDLLKNGSDKKTLLEIRQKAIDLIKNSNDKDIRDTIKPIEDRLCDASYEFLNAKNLRGIDIIESLVGSVYIGGDTDYEIYISGGKQHDVDANTYFDIASITKLYTLLLQDKLIEQGYFKSTDKIGDILDFGSFEDFTFEDLSLLVGELRTNGNIAAANSFEEAVNIFKTVYVYSNDRTVNKYSDIPAMVAAVAMTRIYNEANNTSLNYEEILYKVLLHPNGLYNTVYNPTASNVTGNGNNMNLVHDPKTRILGGVSGAAGIFTTAEDLVLLAKGMFSNKIVSEENLGKYSTITFPNSPQNNKGHYGLYVKNKEHTKSFCPRDYSNGTFAHQGYTGSLAIFDSINKLHNGILVNALNPELEQALKNDPLFKEYMTNSKANGYIEAIHTYQDYLTKYTLLLSIIKGYMDEFIGKESVKVNVKI